MTRDNADDIIENAILQAANLGLVRIEGDSVVLTDKGREYLRRDQDAEKAEDE